MEKAEPYCILLEMDLFLNLARFRQVTCNCYEVLGGWASHIRGGFVGLGLPYKKALKIVCTLKQNNM